MLVPAMCYKEEIERAVARLAYTDKLMWYDGCIENFRHELTDESDKYHFAIDLFQGRLVLLNGIQFWINEFHR